MKKGREEKEIRIGFKLANIGSASYCRKNEYIHEVAHLKDRNTFIDELCSYQGFNT